MSNNRVETHAAHQFVVQIDGISSAAFTECTLPSLEVEVEEEKEGGYNEGVHLLPGRVLRGTLTLKRGISTDQALIKWYNEVLQGQLGKALRQVSVILYSLEGQPVARWDFKNAYPTKWSSPTLKTGESELALESLELAYESVAVT
ncbi:MAG: phage tail protein [Chloroflexi bacterium]|nr:phage tail protein [Chloroflexota bacterium]